MPVKIVTDSLADLPQDVAKSLGIEVVPLFVRFGTEEFKDRVSLSADEFYRRLLSGQTPSTAVPAVGEFVEVYERLANNGDSIVSIHVSSKVSGTFNSAVQGAKQASVKCPIEVMDSLQASIALGLIVMAAAKSAMRGDTHAEVVQVAKGAMERSQCVTMLDTLEYLEKGGRIGKAQALLGSLLSFKPMIGLRDGEVHAFDRPRTRAKGLARLRQYAAEWSPAEGYCLMHSTTPDEAQKLLDELRSSISSQWPPFVARYGPGLGTYVGPGALGIAVLRAARPA
ncbi:MAG: DegV family protein [SAR202 cluster bacterium]|nr:DegV family protein [SAR202 cluster bacterium]